MQRLTTTGYRLHVWAAVCVLAGTTMACMVSPTDGTEVCGTDAVITFRGYTLSPNETVELQASSDGRRFTTFATTATTTRRKTIAGTTVYPWTRSVQVPSWASHRRGYGSFVRSRTVDSELFTFDSVLPAGKTPEGCITELVDSGMAPADALSACASANTPIVTLEAPLRSTCRCPTSHNGDVVIANAKDAALWSCLQTLNGNLSVLSSAPSTVDLTALQVVQGALSLNYTTNGVVARSINLPVLQQVWDDLTIDGTVSTGPVALGLPALNWAVGNVFINLENTGPSRVVVTGLDDFFVVPSQYSLSLTSHGAFDSTNFMPSFHSTETISVQSTGLNPSVGLPLRPPNLELAITLEVEYPPGLPPYPSFEHKQSVLFPQLKTASYLHIQNDPFYAATSPYMVERVYPKLASVGILRLDGTQLANLDIGANGMQVGMLELKNNPSLVSLDGGAFSLANYAAINITNNPALRECLVSSYFTALATWGHTGTRTSAGNNPTTCGVCSSSTTHNGDLTIDNAASAINARCVGTVTGNLTIAEAPRTLNVDLPVLTSVAGDASLSFTLRRDVTLLDRRQVSAPVLSSVGGNLTLDAHYPDLPPAGVNMGLNALTFVGGDVEVSTGHGPLQGLAGLTTLGGSLSLSGNGLDGSGLNFVPNLTSIGGNLHMQNYYAFIDFFDSVATVGGDVEIIAVRMMGGLDHLTTVGGDLVLKPSFYFPPQALATVGGSIVIDSVGLTNIDVSAVPVTAGGLTLTNNPNFNTLDNGVSLIGNKPLTIVGNPNLNTCQAQTYAQLQLANGFTGPVTVSGNGGSGCP